MTNELDSLQGAVADDAADAAASAVTAQSYADVSLDLSNVVGLWSNLSGALSVPATCIHNDRLWVLNTNTTNVAADEPGVSAKWTLYVRTEQVHAVTGTTPALSPANGTIQTWALTGNSTPTAGTWTAGQSMTLMVNDGTARTINWASMAITWIGGTAPTLATSGYTVIEFWKVGTTIYGALVGAVA
jgi:hypothetical protein